MSQEVKSDQKSIVYVANIRLPTEKAHGIQIVHTCQELVKQGVPEGYSFELVVSERERLIDQDIFSYYGVTAPFEILKIPTLKLHTPQSIFFWLQRIQFSLKALKYISKKYNPDTVIYSRDEFLLWVFSFRFKNIFLEIHENKINIFFKLIRRKLRAIISISQGLKELYTKSIPAKQVCVVPDAVQIEVFDIAVDRELTRKQLNLPLDKKIITYIGSIGLYSWKGIDTFLDAHMYSHPDTVFLVVGGKEADVLHLKKTYTDPRILFVGHKNPKDIPLYQKVSDILVIPNKQGDVVSEKYTSPMKLFEYMASGVPIVCSDLPSMREVLDASMATFFEPNNSLSLHTALRKVLDEYQIATEKAGLARSRADQYSYVVRSRTILETIKRFSL